jgi:hypothetical protein
MEPCAILDYFPDLDNLITELPQQIYSGILISDSFQFANCSCCFAFLYLWYWKGVSRINVDRTNMHST